MRNTTRTALAALIILATPALGSTAWADAHSGAPADGDIALPGDFTSWPLFAKHINKKAHVRDIYINATGAASRPGEPLADGTTFVMTIYNATKDASGTPIRDAEGNLGKSSLAKVFVMKKGNGWGVGVPENQRTGDWVYAAYTADGAKADVDY
ncbi:MAG: cytochrome P460 family protein, partial [Gammaproteobacteria bacterium]